MRTTAFAALAFLLALTGSAPVVAEDDFDDEAQDEPQDVPQDEPLDMPDDIPDTPPAPPPTEDSLAPYGTWLYDATYGPVWQPGVAVGWRPYVYGHWTWSSFGWTWVSAEPWAPTFHYGRWVLGPVGWVWVPGTVWGPAWVDWYWNDGYVGWAPLGPTVTHVTVVDRFVFVPERDFCHRGIDRWVVDRRRVPTHVIHGWPHRDYRPPTRDHIVRVTHQPVPRWHGPHMDGGGRRVDHNWVHEPSPVASHPNDRVWGKTAPNPRAD